MCLLFLRHYKDVNNAGEEIQNLGQSSVLRAIEQGDLLHRVLHDLTRDLGLHDQK